MNCAEFERLIDAYLDGELAGSLRVEFDAHRLRCRRCQLTMIAMESVETVLANDRPLATLSDDFTERVMGAIQSRRPVASRLRPRRIVLAAGLLLQAAALMFLAIHPWHEGGSVSEFEPVQVAPVESEAVRDLDLVYELVDRKTEERQALVDRIFAKLEAAGMNVATDLTQLVSYASALPVPDDVARASDGMHGANPLNLLIDVFIPGAAPELESTPIGTVEHAL
ncbi:MAG TPA: zf-HC2 domain-containing protein [Phycisphaerae bacterium]|jgi:hypothetical protein|nr:zf-HC2 domain-containing protein [Phycisphaerae bacterium]HRT43219.1 zf-HC2 domain-containing protein [Phycisphaerae bacterium]